MPDLDLLLFLSAGLVFLGILSSKISSKLGVPSLILFVAVGILAGPEGIGHLTLDTPRLVQAIGTLALINILFSGGIESRWSDLKPVLLPGLLLATIGLCINAIIIATAANLFFGLDWSQGLLFGSILGCTDAAAVFAVLRTKKLALKSGLGTLAEFESAANDPMAVFLSITLIALIRTPGASAISFVPMFFLQMGIGAAIGAAMGIAIPWIINFLSLDQEGLYPPLTMALSVLTYAIASKLHGSGYLAAYVTGIVMGQQRFYHKQSLIRFHGGLAWLMQIIMFVTLGLILHPSAMLPTLPKSLLIGLVLLLIARPVSVLLTLAASRFSIREKLMLSWLGLRGAVPIILGTFLLYSGVPAATFIANMVFAIVLLSVLLQGTTLSQFARWLGVSRKSSSGITSDEADTVADNSVLTEVVVPSDSQLVGRSVMSLGFDEDCRIMLIHRVEGTFVPTGRTQIAGCDVLVILAPPNRLPKAFAVEAVTA